jgi:hypothetical protein
VVAVRLLRPLIGLDRVWGSSASLTPNSRLGGRSEDGAGSLAGVGGRNGGVNGWT